MRQKLGQHFLKDQNVLNDIAEAVEITKRDTVIEIGPGHGELTSYLLLRKPKKFIAIEKDHNFSESLQGNLLKLDAEVIEGDVLKELPKVISNLNGDSYKIVGNIPYYITGFLMRVLGEVEPKPQKIVLMIQKEVAERICSEPPKMNLLAASVQFWGTPEIIGLVKRSSFHPRPDVDSAIISITPKKLGLDAGNENYYKFLKLLFRQPRKKILNNIRDGLDLTKPEIESVIRSIKVSLDSRPGNLDIATILELSRVFADRT